MTVDHLFHIPDISGLTLNLIVYDNNGIRSEYLSELEHRVCLHAKSLVLHASVNTALTQL